jgi:DNA repair protein RecO (recombination protein O)
MASRTSESFVLRTYPFREGDLIVSFLTRDYGKLRGVARRARKPKGPFGAGLERLSQVRMTYLQKENRELANLYSCELIASPFALASSYEMSLALDYIAEVAENLLPPAEPNELMYRLLAAVLEDVRGGGSLWRAVTYFALWSVRLGGFLPELKLRQESVAIAEEMLRTPVGRLAEREWARSTAADLRRALDREIEAHTERRLLTAPMLESL